MVTDPGGVDPDPCPTFKKKPASDVTVEKNRIRIRPSKKTPNFNWIQIRNPG